LIVDGLFVASQNFHSIVIVVPLHFAKSSRVHKKLTFSFRPFFQYPMVNLHRRIAARFRFRTSGLQDILPVNRVSDGIQGITPPAQAGPTTGSAEFPATF
jgi:hypothetical protein